MSVLTSEQVENLRARAEQLTVFKVYRDVLNLIDTITDRDGTIETLQAKIEELKGAYQELLTESGFEDGWTGVYYLTCGAVKEPEAVVEEHDLLEEAVEEFAAVTDNSVNHIGSCACEKCSNKLKW